MVQGQRLRAGLASTCFVCLAGCATTQPLDSASIHYRLPRTDAAVQLALTLKECRADGFEVAADLNVVAQAGAQSEVYQLSGDKLASARIKRELKVTVSDQGVITAINAATADQTPTIIANALKAAAVVATFSARGPANLSCQDHVVAATRRVEAIDKQITQLRKQLASSSTPTPSPADLQYMREVNLLARELSSLRGGLLRVELKGKIELNATEQPVYEPVKLDYAPLKKWLGASADVSKAEEHFGLLWQASVDDGLKYTSAHGGGAEEKLRTCEAWLLLPKVQYVKIVTEGAGASVKSLRAELTVPAAQWSEAPGQLCLDAGIGESPRSVSLAFNQYGQTKEFGWSSEASGATIATALAGTVPEAANIAKGLRGPSELERQKAEIDALETQQKLNKLRACQAVLDAGGADCDENKE